MGGGGGGGLSASAVAGSAVSGGAVPHVMPNAFLRPLNECEFNLTSILEELQRDPYPVKSDSRPWYRKAKK